MKTLIITEISIWFIINSILTTPTHSGILLHPQFPYPGGWNVPFDLQPQPPPECARIWDSLGGVLHLHLNQNSSPLDNGFNFVPIAVEMGERAILIMIDIYHEISIFTETTSPLLGQCPIRFASCESCLGKGPRSPLGQNGNSSICAILYEAPFCATTLERAYEVLEGEQEPGTRFDLKGTISSVMVRDGCTLEIYSEEGFQGNVASVNGTLHRLDWEWDNQIASFKCWCNGQSTQTPSPITTTPRPAPITTKMTTTPKSTTASPQTSPMTPETSTSSQEPSTSPKPTPQTSPDPVFSSEPTPPPTTTSDIGLTIY